MCIYTSLKQRRWLRRVEECRIQILKALCIYFYQYWGAAGKQLDLCLAVLWPLSQSELGMSAVAQESLQGERTFLFP